MLDAQGILMGLTMSIIGAWVGASFALTRFKKERSFERHIGWLEQQITTMTEAHQQLRRLKRAGERSDIAAIQELKAPLTVVHDRVDQAVVESLLHVDPASTLYALIIAVAVEIGQIVDLPHKTAFEEAATVIDTTMRDFQVTVSAFALKLRRQLKDSAMNVASLEDIRSDIQGEPSEGLRRLRRRAGLDK